MLPIITSVTFFASCLIPVAVASCFIGFVTIMALLMVVLMAVLMVWIVEFLYLKIKYILYRWDIGIILLKKILSPSLWRKCITRAPFLKILG